MFDGLDMHLYTLVATPFVAELLGASQTDPDVGRKGSIIQAAFLLGWALGGGFFGRIADRIGRSRALVLTILTYAAFTGLSFFAQAWWHLLAFRFLAALGIGGEWAVGASLLAESWPTRWRPWLAAILQSAYNCGTVVASISLYLLAGQPSRYVFLVGVLPALIVVWIRRAVPEPAQWHEARAVAHEMPKISALFAGSICRVTVLTILVCGLSLSAHWAFIYWFPQQLRTLPELADWSQSDKNKLVAWAMQTIMISSVVGNFLAAWIATWIGFRRTIVVGFVAYCLALVATYTGTKSHQMLLACLPPIGLCQGAFALFTMYLPPLFPTLLRTTGAGFSYNIGRIAAALATVVFGVVSQVADYSAALRIAGLLFLPAAFFAAFLPDPGTTGDSERVQDQRQSV